MRRRRPDEPASTAALVLAFIGIFFFPFAVFALCMAWPHRRRNGNARQAVALAYVGLVIGAALIVLLVAHSVYVPY